MCVEGERVWGLVSNEGGRVGYVWSEFSFSTISRDAWARAGLFPHKLFGCGQNGEWHGLKYVSVRQGRGNVLAVRFVCCSHSPFFLWFDNVFFFLLNFSIAEGGSADMACNCKRLVLG